MLPPASADRSPSVAGIRKAMRSQDFASSEKMIDELIRMEPTNFEGYFWRGFLAQQRHNYYDAIRSFRRAEALDANPYVLKQLAFSYYFLGQFRLFTSNMQQVIQKQPGDFAPYYYLGRYYVSTDVADFAKASGYFQDALDRNPHHYAAHYYLGYCNENQRKVADAAREYQRSMELAEAAGEKFGLPYQGMARLNLLDNKSEEALPFALKAVEFAPDDAAGHAVLARVYAALHRTDQAAIEWQRAAQLDPVDPMPHYRLYRLYLEAGNKEKAEKSLADYTRLSALYGNN